MAVTSSTVLRPASDVYLGAGVVFSSGSTAWTLLDDGGAVVDTTGADDNTYIRVAGGSEGFTKGRVILGLTNLGTITSSQRIKQVRLRGRVRLTDPVPGFGATIRATFRDPQSGLGRSRIVYAQVDDPYDELFSSNATTFLTRTGAWRLNPPTNDGGEWTKAILDRGQVECVFYFTDDGAGLNRNLRLSELYVDVDVRDQPTVSGVTVAGADTTRPTVSWTYNANADGDRQISYRVKVFTAAQYGAAGFDPATSLATWDSGERPGPSTNQEIGTDLLNGGTYKVYVVAAQDFNRAPWYSPWAVSSPFTVAITPPPAPVFSVTSDPTVPNLRTQFQFSATLNALVGDDAAFEASVGNWVALTGGAVSRSTAQFRNGTASLLFTANGGAGPAADNSGNSGAGGVATRPGAQHSFGGYTRAGTTTRAWRLTARWYTASPAAGGTLISESEGSTVTNSNSAWTALPTLTATAPAGATVVFVGVESTATPANGELHYFDQVQVVPGGTLPPWAPGFLATSTAVIERAVATSQPRNMVSRQLYGGGDDTLDASGFYTSGTTSAVTFDMLDRVRGLGSVRWDVEDAGSKLYFGWPAATQEDPAPAYALAAVPGRTYTFSVYLRATTATSSQLVLQAINASGSTVGSATNGGPVVLGASWTRYSATITVPSGAVYVRPHLDNSGGVTGRKVWADAAQWELGAAVTDLTHPGGVALTWEAVRGFLPGKTAVPAGTQSLVAFDHEVPPGQTILYRAWIYALDPASGQALSSPLTAYYPTLIDAPGGGQWMLSEVGGAPFLRGKVNVLAGIAESQHEEVTAYYPIRPVKAGQVGQRPVHLSDYIGGHDMTLQLAVLSYDDEWLVDRLLARQDALWFTESQGGGRYLRVKDRSWQRTRFRDKCVNLADGTVLRANEWEQVVTIACDEAEAPPDNETAVLFGVEPVTTSPGGGEPPPAGELLFPGAPTNWITTGTGVCCNSASVNTTGGVTHDVGGNAGCNTAGTSPYTPAVTYSQWGIAGFHRRLEWKLRIDDDDPGHGHFWALQASLQGQGSGQQFSAGLQRNGSVDGVTGKLALFSVWGATGAVTGAAAGAVASSFVVGTAGYRVAAPYDWTLGASYTLRVQADDARGADWWRFDVIADAGGAITYIGSVQVPAAWGDINGAYAIASTEWFTDPGGRTSCLQIPRVTAFVGTPGYATTLGSAPGGGGGSPTSAVAQGMLLGLHRPLASDSGGSSGSGLYHDSYGQY
jgi:hypothetical protein